MFRTVGLTLVFAIIAPVAIRAELPPSFPGLTNLIDEADAIAVVRIDEIEARTSDPSKTGTLECFVYETLKGAPLPPGLLRIQMIDLHSTITHPYSSESEHLVFLARSNDSEGLEFHMLNVPGSSIQLHPRARERKIVGETTQERIGFLIEEALDFNFKRFVNRQHFLEKMIPADSETRTAADSIRYDETRPIECVLRLIIRERIPSDGFDLNSPIVTPSPSSTPDRYDWLISFKHKTDASKRLRFGVQDYRKAAWLLNSKTLARVEK